MMRYLLIFLLPLVTLLQAESFEEFKQAEMKAFKAYKDALDKEFADYLNQPWKPFDSKKSKAKLKPKPQVIKPIETVKEPGKKAPVIEVPKIKKEVKVAKIEKVPEVEPVIVKVPEAKVTPQNINMAKTQIIFYGHKLVIKYENPLDNRYSTMMNRQKISDAWKAFATSEYVELLNQVKESVKVLNLNDWGQIKLLEKIGGKLFRNRNESRLFTWFIFTKLGYDIKVGFARQNVVLMTPINTNLYSTTYFKIGGKKYYAIDYTGGKKVGRIKTYEKPHPAAKNSFDLRIDKRPMLKQYKTSRSVAFKYKNREYKLDLDYDKVYVAYYKNYPQVEYDNYFKAPVSPIADASFKNNVAKLIEGKGEVEAVNLLLRLVQKGFDYKIDQTQFGYEKVMLPEETLFYPYSDCEDRSILFSKLVNDLLGLEVVGIKFPEHLATAVVLKSRLSGGTSFVKDGKRYYIADPTYLGADVGMIPPRYKGVGFEVIKGN